MPFPSNTHTVGRARQCRAVEGHGVMRRGHWKSEQGRCRWATGERDLRSRDWSCSLAPQILGPETRGEFQVFVAGNGSSWVLRGPARTVLGRSGRSVSPGGRDCGKQGSMRLHVGHTQACGPRTPALCEACLFRGFAPRSGALSVGPSSSRPGAGAISRTLGDTDGARAASAAGLDFRVILRCGRLWSFPPASHRPQPLSSSSASLLDLF